MLHRPSSGGCGGESSITLPQGRSPHPCALGVHSPIFQLFAQKPCPADSIYWILPSRDRLVSISPSRPPKSPLWWTQRPKRHDEWYKKRRYFWFEHVILSLKTKRPQLLGWKTPFRPSGSCLDGEILTSDPQSQPIRPRGLHVPHALARFAGPGLKKGVQTHLQGWFPFHVCPGQWRHTAIKMELVKAGRKTHFHLVSNYFLIFLPPQLTWKFPIHPTQNTGISSLSSPNKTQLEWSESTISWCKK